MIVAFDGNAPPGQNRKNLPDRNDSDDPPDVDDDYRGQHAGKGENVFTYDNLYRMISSIDGNRRCSMTRRIGSGSAAILPRTDSIGIGIVMTV